MTKTPEEIAWFEELKRKNKTDIQNGVRFGWWEKVENGIPIPFAINFKLSDFPENAQIAHLMVKIGLFDSLTQARKAGKTQPLTVGEHRFKNPAGGMKRVILE